MANAPSSGGLRFYHVIYIRYWDWRGIELSLYRVGYGSHCEVGRVEKEITLPLDDDLSC